MMPRYMRTVVSACLILSTLCNVGCTTFKSPFGTKIPTATAADPATQILCFWQPGEGNDPDGYPCRGFSGQILFTSNKSQAPVKIDGDVRIYLFDDQGTVDEQAKPLRQFDFDGGSWNIHLGKTSLGPTYSIFIPYVRRGVTEANCSLRIRLKPKHGPTIFSDFSSMPLNPTKKVKRGEDAKPMEKEEVEQIGLDALTSVLKRTTTIPVAANGKPKAPEPAQPPAASNPIQQASHQVVSDAPNADAERIRQLEETVRQLKEQKDAIALPPAAPPRQIPAAMDRDEEPIEPVGTRRRFQVRADRDVESRPPSRSSHLLEEDDDGTLSRLAPRSSNRSATRHPLDLNSDE